VRTADCAALAFGSPQGVVGVAHAGWRGLAAGVIQTTLDWMRSFGAEQIEAGLGPCIGPECYEFGTDDLDRLAAAFGSGVRGVTRAGAPALDLRAGVAEVLDREGVPLVHVDPRCTACEAGALWSHRARGDAERQGVVAWLN
jgi:polyphenol oxidase